MRRTVLVVVLVLVGVVALSSSASAQVIQNPTGVTFTASADHTPTVAYTIGYIAPGATSPTQEALLGTGTPAADGTLTFSINVRPLSFATAYTAVVKACAGTACSPWSDPSNPFDRVPGKPGKPVPK